MRNRRSSLLLVLALATVPFAVAQRPNLDHVPGVLIVQHRVAVSDATARQALGRFGVKVQKEIPQLGVSVLEVPEAAANAVAAALNRTNLFTYVERDGVAHSSQTVVDPNDPDFISQWHLSKIQAPSGWSLTTGAPSVTIAVIDSGVDSTHPDLSSKVTAGWNFLNGTSNTADVLGHGTAVAGAAAAATDNLTGIAGVAWGNMIMPLVVLNSSNYASYSNIASAITYAADHGARVINISIGGSTSSSTLQSAVNYAWNKGALIFASAMNNSSSTPYYPAACTNVIAMSATDQNDNLASFSDYGSWIDLSAPGVNILTTNNGGGYGYWYGTSFSSPIAAASAALVLSLKPSLSASGLVSLLEKNSDDLGSAGWDQYFGWGRINVYKALTAASQTVTVNPPTVSISSPANGATVSNTISVQGTATSSLSIASVQFLVDNQQVASGTSASFSFSWNSTTVANGTHTLTIKATDSSANVGTASISVNVSNTAPAPTSTTPPVVTITSPGNGSIVSGMVQISVSATDSLAISQVSIYVDNVLKCTDTSTPYTCNWNTKKVSSGSHTIKATAWDAANNSASASITVTK